MTRAGDERGFTTVKQWSAAPGDRWNVGRPSSRESDLWNANIERIAAAQRNRGRSAQCRPERCGESGFLSPRLFMPGQCTPVRGTWTGFAVHGMAHAAFRKSVPGPAGSKYGRRLKTGVCRIDSYSVCQAFILRSATNVPTGMYTATKPQRPEETRW